ncbi:diguanylate cyclase domain-containing protein [Orenia marismortui]|uniref:PAS domain S-box-containing protein/diguanylate cyclase (GGDEF)-like protein n=1 Tax=Orenia marismortui TaxID=46469 RepID=A0A4R8H393_9FIRM|nr:diguanylate cyclase [Orenia marismortui]TDX53210.1 PAS domain S-box-containing protein/diguanylate cyclase (GGDEF)-like protein [Orenia marismortui]
MLLIIAITIILLSYILCELKKRRSSYYQSLFKDNHSVIILLDPQSGNLIDANSAAISYYGYTKEELLTKNITEINTLSQKDVKIEMKRSKKEEKKHFYFQHRLADGEIRDVEVYSGPIKVDNKILLYSIVHDITEKKKAEEEISYLTFHDPVTNLYNRSYYQRAIKELDLAENYPISIIMGDINGLKLTNDVFGHQCGDKLLIEVSNILKSATRSSDIVVRWGGDEFCILLAGSNSSEAKEVIKRIKSKCQNSNFDPIPPSISLGYDTKYDSETELEEVFKIAEDRMYDEKEKFKATPNNYLINSFMKKLYSKNNYILENNKRVKDLAIKLGKELNLSQVELDKLSLLAEYHDIGHLRLSEDLVNNEDRISDQEKERIKKHSRLGYDIARRFSYLNPISEYILYHHENWDGSGYPKGLKGEKIPLLSQIIHLVDIYDALLHKIYYILDTEYDCYNCTIDLCEINVLDEIKRKRGVFFDPKLVDSFLRLFDQ